MLVGRRAADTLEGTLVRMPGEFSIAPKLLGLRVIAHWWEMRRCCLSKLSKERQWKRRLARFYAEANEPQVPWTLPHRLFARELCQLDYQDRKKAGKEEHLGRQLRRALQTYDQDKANEILNRIKELEHPSDPRSVDHEAMEGTIAATDQLTNN